MESHDPPLGIKELADMIDTSYEHARRMVRGALVPSKFVIRAIAQSFKVNPEELEAVAKTDKFKREYGDGTPTPIFNAEVAPFAKSWHMLRDDQRAALLRQLKGYLNDNLKIMQKQSKGAAHPRPKGGD